jgi:hypothetical protein
MPSGVRFRKKSVLTVGSAMECRMRKSCKSGTPGRSLRAYHRALAKVSSEHVRGKFVPQGFGGPGHCTHELRFVGHVCEVSTGLEKFFGAVRSAAKQAEASEDLKTDDGH